MTANRSLTLTALFLAASAGSLAQTLAPVDKRHTDGVIQEDMAQFDAVQTRIRALNDSGRHPLSSYSLAKAQCWLDVARHEYQRNDRSAFPQAALTQAANISSYLERGGAFDGAQNPARQTPLVNGADRLREDLWKQTQELMAHPGAVCAHAQLACAEVALVHAGNEHRQFEWRHAAPYVGMAEDRIARARQAAAACPAAVAPVAAPQVASVAAPPVAPSRPQRWSLNGDALFAFNRHRVADLLPAGRMKLDEIATTLKLRYARIDHIQISGHTDHIGSPMYNDHLSWMRAEAVRDYLVTKGVDAPMALQGMGARQPIKACPENLQQSALIACLQPNRRVELAITGRGQ